jgi:hypothetical protein
VKTSQHPDPERFQDPRSHLYDYVGEILVRCPNCGQRARVAPVPTTTSNERPVFTPRRVSCLSCAYFVDQPAASGLRIYRDGRDPYFGLQLWFTTDCAGHLLWAYNIQHLELLESFVSADLRERGLRPPSAKSSLVERLPSWMKQAKHRDEILKAIERLRGTTD